MAKKKHKSSLAAGEMELLSLLWQHGPMTLSKAHQEFGASIGYTTMQTRLNRLADKGLVHRSDARPAKYSAAVAPEDISANQLDVLIHRVTDGRVVPLVAQLVNKRSLSATEIEEIKLLIEQAEKRVLRKGKTK